MYKTSVCTSTDSADCKATNLSTEVRLVITAFILLQSILIPKIPPTAPEIYTLTQAKLVMMIDTKNPFLV